MSAKIALSTSATISSTGFGARWGGLVLDGIVGSRIQLSGTQLVEGSPLLTVSGYGEMVAENVKSTTGALLILLLVGALAGTWLISGIIPSMIYYGLQILNPTFFLVAFGSDVGSSFGFGVTSSKTGSPFSTFVIG